MRRVVLALAIAAASATASANVMANESAPATPASPARTSPTPTPSPPSVAKITLNPTSGPPDSQVLLTGKGFPPGETIDVYIDTQDTGLGLYPVDSQGEFAISLLVATGPGPHQFCVDPPVLCAQFTVTPFQPKLTVQPNAGPPGITFTITGSGFPAGEIVALYVDSPTQYLSTPGPLAESDGGFATAAVMRSVVAGPHDVCGDTGAPAGKPQQYTVKACVSFTVTSLALPSQSSPSTVPPLPSPAPSDPATVNAANVSPSRPVLPIAGGIALLVIALGASAFFWMRRTRRPSADAPRGDI